ncbi:hemerythrin domain-containing protein [Rubrivivax sp. A210]|uniref:hemerythrin domain-containing protein n=1 Tax=Rubrivivax sp. A210 TaxID=2772301 RepID=UPI001917F087|nr:hemerythrin domain-containing protein [Rubrivivax sp. A210]
MSLTTPLREHHRHCDDIFARAEEDATEGRWDQGAASLALLQGQLEAHFASEEELLFPAFEAATGMCSGPTAIMRGEHAQMRDLLAQLGRDLAARDAEGYGGTAETLLILMQQHNLKEENILYPMCDRAVAGAALAAGLAGRLAQA